MVGSSVLTRAPLSPLSVRGKRFEWGTRTYLMGIVNVTPDSFSGDGVLDNPSALQTTLERLVTADCDIIDVGGESTRPGHTPVTEEEELARVIPALTELRRRTDLPISIDTFKPAVAERAIAVGADIINCVWGAPQQMTQVAIARRVPLIVMHNQAYTSYERDCTNEVIDWLRSQTETAIRAGLPAQHLIVDPGIGFGKTAVHNLEILTRLAEFKALAHPLLLGVSRKSFIGKLTGQDASHRAFGTAAAVSLGVAAGADIVRVHDAVEMRSVIQVADAIVRQRWDAALA